MSHPSLDLFSQELLRRIVPAGPGSQPLPLAGLRAQRETLCLDLPNLPLPDMIETLFASQIAASHVVVMECFRRAMLHDVSDRTQARLRLRTAALMRLCAGTLRLRDRALVQGVGQTRKNVPIKAEMPVQPDTAPIQANPPAQPPAQPIVTPRSGRPMPVQRVAWALGRAASRPRPPYPNAPLIRPLRKAGAGPPRDRPTRMRRTRHVAATAARASRIRAIALPP